MRIRRVALTSELTCSLASPSLSTQLDKTANRTKYIMFLTVRSIQTSVYLSILANEIYFFFFAWIIDLFKDDLTHFEQTHLIGGQIWAARVNPLTIYKQKMLAGYTYGQIILKISYMYTTNAFWNLDLKTKAKSFRYIPCGCILCPINSLGNKEMKLGLRQIYFIVKNWQAVFS